MAGRDSFKRMRDGPFSQCCPVLFHFPSVGTVKPLGDVMDKARLSEHVDTDDKNSRHCTPPIVRPR
jgi:hypothetical protein